MRKHLLLVLGVFLIGASSPVEGLYGHSLNKALQAEILKAAAHPASADWLSLAQEGLAMLGSPLTSRIVWNKDYTHDDKLSIIVFDSGSMPTGTFRLIAGNCLYVSDFHVITCDIMMFKYLNNLYALSQKQETTTDESGHIVERYLVANDPDLIKQSYLYFFGWVLGHELGHAYHNHQGAFRYLSSDAGKDEDLSKSSNEIKLSVTDSSDSTSPAESREIKPVNSCHQREKQADEFFHATLVSKSLYEKYYSFLLDLMNKDVRRSACPDTSILLPCEKILYGTGFTLTLEKYIAKNSSTHPDFLVRMLDLMDGIKLTYRYPDDAQEGGFHKQITDFRNGNLYVKQLPYVDKRCLN